MSTNAERFLAPIEADLACVEATPAAERTAAQWSELYGLREELLTLVHRGHIREADAAELARRIGRVASERVRGAT